MNAKMFKIVEFGPWVLRWDGWQVAWHKRLSLGHRIASDGPGRTWRVVPLVFAIRHPIDAWGWWHGGTLA